MTDTLITILASSITGVVTFIVGVLRTRKELEGMAINNVEKSMIVYASLIENLKIQIEELLVKVDELEDKVDRLTKENSELKDMLRNKK